MARLILVPQFPTRLRYQEWWVEQFQYYLGPLFDELIILGEEQIQEASRIQSNDSKHPLGGFAPQQLAISLELHQVQQFMLMYLYNDDILLLNDLSFPGFFANAFFHKKVSKCVAICHATSVNYFDYFYEDRLKKFPIEGSQAMMFNKVIVATEYHKQKLGWSNLEVMPLPDPPMHGHAAVEGKKYEVVSAARKTKQKRDISLEKHVEDSLDLRIKTLHSDTWEEYYWQMSLSKVLFISSREETYGYQVVDAIKNRCIPIAPNHFSYPELLPPEYLYDSGDEAVQKVHDGITGKLPVLDSLKTSERSGSFFIDLANLLKSL